MNTRIRKTMSRSSLKYAGFVAVLVCTMAAAQASAKAFSLDGHLVEPVHAETSVMDRLSSHDVILAQYADDDCGCDDVEDYGDDFDEDFGDNYANEDFDDNDEGYHGGQGTVQTAQDPTGKMLERQGRLIEQMILWRNPMGPGVF